MTITYSRRTPYHELDNRISKVHGTITRHLLVAFEADDLDEVSTAHLEIRDRLKHTGQYLDWLTGHNPRCVWSDGSLVGSQLRNSPVGIYLRTWIHDCRSGGYGLRCSTSVRRGFRDSPTVVSVADLRHRAYLDNFSTFMPEGTYHLKDTQLPLEPTEPAQNTATVRSPTLNTLLVLLDRVPYDLADRVLTADLDAIYELGKYPFEDKEYNRSSQRVTDELLTNANLRITAGVI